MFRRKLTEALDRLTAFEPDAEPSEEESEGEQAPAQTSSRATTMHTNVHDPVMGNPQVVRQVQVPNEVSVTTSPRLEDAFIIQVAMCCATKPQATYAG